MTFVTAKAILGLYWRVRILFFALRWVTSLNLGDRVVTADGKEWVLAQGVCKPYWDLDPFPAGGKRAHLHESEFRKVRSLSNYLGSFRYGWWFYMTSWHAIWVNQGIKPWMRALPIWGKK
jgi:hypothetical protein